MTSLIVLCQFIIYTLVSIFGLIYLYFIYSYTYWKRKGVPYLKPHFPLGNNDCIGVEAFSYGTETWNWYKELKRRGLKYGGAWSWAKPVLVLTDPEYFKDVLLKDFLNFADRDFYHNPKYDPKNENIFVAEQEQGWKYLRQKMTPTFTSAKMKMMFPLVAKCADPMMNCFREASESGDVLKIKEVVASFTTDVIGCVGFGLDFGSFTSKDAPFRKMGKEIFRTTAKRKLFLILSRLCSNIAQKLGINNMPKDVTQFFAKVIEETVQYRKESNVEKQDYLQLLIELYESTREEEHPFTFDNLVGNVVTFFVAGFDTSSTTMHFALYELAQKPDLQVKARKEIKKVLNKYNGELTYEAYQDMAFIRQIIDETLRIYPPVQTVTRICMKPYTFKNSNFTLEKGVTVIIPVLAVGRDSDYYPDPDHFDPERFNAENKAKRNAFVYLPFGEGPRNCIGKRFGLMQSSIGLIRILEKYEISINNQTEMPLTLKRGLFLMQPNETLYLNAKKIE